MPKLPPLIVLAMTATLVTGCVSTAAENPDAGPTPSATPAATTPAPSATRSATSSVPATAASQDEATEEAAGAATDGAGAATSGIEGPSATTEPPRGSPAGEPAAETAESMVVTPGPEWGAVSTSVPQGASFTLTGSEYEPGQVVRINLGIARTDSMVMEEQFAEVDAAGSYEFTLTLAPDLGPGTYGILTLVWDGDSPVPNFEETKRFATVEVLPA